MKLAVSPNSHELDTIGGEVRVASPVYAVSISARTVYIALGMLTLFGCYTYTFPATLGDAAIYFPYFKNFFHLPFSYQPDHVSYGATSALHVVVFSVVYNVFGEYWLLAAKVINFLFVVAGIALVYRSSRLPPVYFPFMCVAACAFEALLVSVAQLFETGLVFFSMSLWLFWLRGARTKWAILLAGVLPLVRPELALVSGVLFCDLVVRRRETRWLPVFVLSAIPVALYAGYMIGAGAGVLPASVVSRALRSVEQRATWATRAAGTFGQLDAEQPAYAYGLALLILFLLRRRARARWEWIAAGPVLALYVLLPPGPYLARYLTPILPVVILGAALLTREVTSSSELPERLRRDASSLSDLALNSDQRERAIEMTLTAGPRVAVHVIMVLLVVATLHSYWSQRQTFQRYDVGTWLLTDLSQELNPRATADDKILLYEIQGQYSLNGYAISVDGTVGNEMQPVLLGQQTMTDFIKRAEVRFVVTSNSFAYRKIFERSILADLYGFDLGSAVGDEVTLDGLTFRKILTNPFFADPSLHVLQHAPDLNVGDTLRTYGPRTPAWYHYQILWNSVYEVQPPAR